MRAQVPGMHDYLKKFLIEFVFITIFVSQSGLFEATLFESYLKKKLLRQISIFFCSFLLDFSPILCNYIINNNHHHIHVTLDDEQTTLFFYSAKMPFHQKNNENKYFISCYRITEKGSQIVIIYPGPGTLQFEIWVPKYSFITLKFFRF